MHPRQQIVAPELLQQGADVEAVYDKYWAQFETAFWEEEVNVGRVSHPRWLMAAIGKFGDFEVAPKKTYVSLRRKKQFAMIGPATKTQVEVGLNAKKLPASDRLTEMPPKSMCTYKCRVSDVREVDAELLGWIRTAFDEAG